MSKSSIQKVIAAVVIVLVLVITGVVIAATRKPKKQEVAETAAVTQTEQGSESSETESETEEETFEYDYDMKLDMAKVADAHEQNEDVVGWIYIDDTVIDYPIVKGKDNEEYLYADWLGEYSYSGCIFEDYRSELARDENALIYGHNMAAGTMFHEIKSYKDEDWGKDHLYVEMATLDKRYLCEVFSVNVLDGLQGAGFEYWNCIQMDMLDFKMFNEAIKNTSTVWYGDTGVNAVPEWGDKVLTLQTCETGDDDGMRCVAFAKILCEK